MLEVTKADRGNNLEELTKLYNSNLKLTEQDYKDIANSIDTVFKDSGKEAANNLS
jgi:hypothetical protein